jgi:tetratricopeptide (TPR) repeat protein
MFFWRRVAPQIPEEGLKPTATPGYMRNFRDLNDQVSRGKSFSGYERNALFFNRKGKGFAEVGGILGVDFEDDARAIATVDWDRDGDLDLWVANRTAPQVRLLRNNQASTHSSIAFLLIGNGKTTNRDAIGARLTLSRLSDGASKQIRTVHAGDGFLAQSSRWTHFGLGEGESDDDDLQLVVRWPGGGTDTFSGLRSGARYTIAQDQGVLGDPVLASVDAVPVAKKEVKTERGASGPERSGFWVANRVPFPNLTCTDGKGVARSTTDFLGKPVLMNRWATWCAPCLVELKDLGKHSDQLRSLGTTVLALNVDGLNVDGVASTKADPERVLARAGYDLPHGIARQENLAKIEILIEYLTSRRSSLAIPTSVLVDAKGNTAAVYLEPVSWEQLEADLALLNAPPAVSLKRASPRAGRWFADPRQIDLAAYLGDYATLYGINGFPKESQRLYQLIRPEEGVRTAREFYNQAKSASQQGLTKQAIEFYENAIRIDPEYGRALTGLGAIFLTQKRIDEAQSLFEKAISIDPNHATALINLAMIEQMRGNLDSAVTRLRKVVALNPEYLEGYLSLGSVLASMKQYDEAIQHMAKAVDLNPKTVVGHLNLAKAYAANGQLDKSEDSYRQVMTLDPRMPYPHFGLGNLQASQTDHTSAVASYRKAISLGAKNAATFTRLGKSLIAMGDKDSGVAAFKDALKLDPQYAGANQALRELVSPAE